MKSFTISSTAVSITDRNDECVRAYLNELNKVHPLDQEEERKLIVAAKDGDQKAFDKLVTSNLRIVVSIAKSYQNRGLSLADLIEEGNTGLIDGARNYDLCSNVRLATYASWYIRRNIISALNEYAGLMKVPGNVGTLLAKIKRVDAKFVQEHGRPATDKELAKALGVSEDKIVDALQTDLTTASLDEPFSHDDGDKGVLGDTVFDEGDTDNDKQLVADDLSKIVNQLVGATLCERDADIVKKLFGIGQRTWSVGELAMKYGLTETRIHQIRNTSLGKMRAYRGVEKFMSYIA